MKNCNECSRKGCKMSKSMTIQDMQACLGYRPVKKTVKLFTTLDNKTFYNLLDLKKKLATG